MTINYVGHADKWDTITIDGDLKKQDAAVSYIHDGKTIAMASVFRDKLSLETESAMEKSG